MIVYKGGENCSFIDIEEHQEKSEIKGLIPSGKSPIAIIGNRKATRGFVLLKESGEISTEFGFYQEGVNPSTYFKIIKNIPKISDANWSCCTSSFDQKYVYLGGSLDGKGVAGVVRFSKSFKFSGFSKLNHGPVNTISRIKGTDIVMVGGDGYLCILTFDKKNSRMSEVYSYVDLKCGVVEDILFLSKKTFFLGRGNGLSVIEYEKEVDQVEFANKENRWMDK